LWNWTCAATCSSGWLIRTRAPAHGEGEEHRCGCTIKQLQQRTWRCTPPLLVELQFSSSSGTPLRGLCLERVPEILAESVERLGAHVRLHWAAGGGTVYAGRGGAHIGFMPH
jgi:hypothetical protein